MHPAEQRMYMQAHQASLAVAHELVKQHSILNVIIANARRDSIAAQAALLVADPANSAEIQRLQNEANLFFRMIDYLRRTIALGDDAKQALAEVDRNELADLILAEQGVSDA